MLKARCAFQRSRSPKEKYLDLAADDGGFADAQSQGYEAVLQKPVSGSTSLRSLQAGRAFASIAVLLFHTTITLALPKYFGRTIFPIFNAGCSGVEYFFVLSGFVIILAHSKDIARADQLPNFLWRRFRRVYVSLWIVIAGVLMVQLKVSSQSHVTAWDIAAAIGILPIRRDILIGVEWTLRHEVLFYLVCAMVIANKRAGALIGCVWLLLSGLSPWLNLVWPLRFVFSIYHILFAFGAIASCVFRNRWLRAPWLVFTAGVVVFASTWLGASGQGLSQRSVAVICFGFGSALAIMGAAQLELERKLRIPNSFVFLGEASYAIYLVHFPIVSAMCKVLVILSRHVRIPDLALFLATALPAVAAGILFHLVVERPIVGSLPTKLPNVFKTRNSSRRIIPGVEQTGLVTASLLNGPLRRNDSASSRH